MDSMGNIRDNTLSVIVCWGSTLGAMGSTRNTRGSILSVMDTTRDIRDSTLLWVL